ncbi:MAG: O-antigen ligase family protein [Ardenticatenaceae bacterium]
MVIKFSSYKVNSYSLLLGLLALLSGIIIGLITAIFSGYSSNLVVLLSLCAFLSVLVSGLLYRFRLQDSEALRVHTQTQLSKARQSTTALIPAPAGARSFHIPQLWSIEALEVKADWLEKGLLLLIFMTYTRFSDVLVHTHGLPSTAQPLVLLLLMLIFFRWATGKYKQAPFRSAWLRASILLASYGLVRFVSLLYAADFAPAQEALLDYVKDAIIAIIVVIVLRRGASLRRVIWALLAAGTFIGTISVIQYMSGAFYYDYLGFGTANVQHIIGKTEDFRISGSIGEPNFYAQTLLPLVALAFERMCNEKGRLRRLLAAWALVACVLAIIFTFSRGALVALAAMVAMMIVLRPPRPKEFLVALLIILPALPFVPAQYVERVTTLIDVLPGMNTDPRSEVSFRGRTSELIAGWMMFSDNPLFGVGLNNYPVHYQDYARRIGLETRREPRAPHSLYIEVMAELGFFGIVTFGALLWNMFHGIHLARKMCRRVGLVEYGNLVTGVGVGLMGYLTAAIFLHAAYPRFWWVLVGVGLAIPQLVRNEKGLLYGNQ